MISSEKCSTEKDLKTYIIGTMSNIHLRVVRAFEHCIFHPFRVFITCRPNLRGLTENVTSSLTQLFPLPHPSYVTATPPPSSCRVRANPNKIKSNFHSNELENLRGPLRAACPLFGRRSNGSLVRAVSLAADTH